MEKIHYDGHDQYCCAQVKQFLNGILTFVNVTFYYSFTFLKKRHATVFMHPVRDDIAPGYSNVVKRPMDLSTIKKNIEAGSIKSTIEFQRDVMLMFTNAIMYNSSNHDVHKIAIEMYKEVLTEIEVNNFNF